MAAITPPTDKQIKLIRKIETVLGLKFTGQTIRQASGFISENLDAYNNKREYLFEMRQQARDSFRI